MRGKKSKGFTITELVITMAIIGILSAIVVPMYTNHIRRARRSDAKVALENVRAMEEQFRAENGGYTLNPVELVSFGWPNGGGVYNAGYYTITLQDNAVNPAPDGFIALATPQGLQFNRDGGVNGWLRIDQEGNKTSGGGPSGAEDLWK